MSWTYLPAPHNSIAVWGLVGESWGKQSFEQIVDMHKNSTTMGFLDNNNNKIIALMNLSPVHSMSSAWVMVWMDKSWRRKRYTMKALWQEARVIAQKDFGFRTLVAITKDPTVVKFATRFGARRGDVIHNLYGLHKHGYIAIWD